MNGPGTQSAASDRQVAVDAVLDSFFSLAKTRARAVGPAFERLWITLENSAAGGKRFRPRLLLSAYCGFGGTDVVGVAPVAAAFELLHTALIVHDDVIDRDFSRRGLPNVSGWYRDAATTAGIPIPTAEHRGMSTAIIAGDLALFHAYRLAERSTMTDGARERVLQIMDEALFASAAGELFDVDYSIALEPPTVDDVVEMERLKTAVYTFESPLLAGAVLAGAAEEHLEALTAFGRNLGIAYQATDDLLGVFGDESRTGKTTLGDLREGKRTVPIAYAATTDAWNGISRFLGKPDLSGQEADRVREMLIGCGAEVFTRGLASRHAGAAIQSLDRLPRAVAEELRPLAAQALERDR